MTSKLKILAFVTALVLTQPVLATIVFSDNFDTETTGLNVTPSQWTVSDGTVDIVGTGFFNLLPGNGFYIDLDGSTRNAGVMTSDAFTLNPGVNYTLLFDLAGSQRGDTNTVRAGVDFNADSFFDVFVDTTLPSSSPFTQTILPFTVASLTSTAHIMFDHSGGDNFGLLLDRVVLNADTPGTPGVSVPIPATLALLGIGLVGLGSARRRKG